MDSGLTIEQLQAAIAALLALDLIALLAVLRRRRQRETLERPQAEGENQTAVDTVPAKASQPVASPSLLSATSSRLLGQIRGLLGGRNLEREELFKELEAVLITGDIGVRTTEKLITQLKTEIRGGEVSEGELESSLRTNMRSVFDEADGRAVPIAAQPTVVVLVGINGVGKTTTAGKLAETYSKSGKKVLLAACDTFRAAAVSQLQIWGERSGVEVVSGPDSMKPATVAYNACKKATTENADLLIIDTAGRLHNKKNLMDELAGVFKIIQREVPSAPHEIFLVVDATSGQNALEQARAFKEICNLTGVIVTKLDGSPRGGMLFAIKSELGIPVRYIGLGEGINDLKPFDPDWFLESLFKAA